MSSKKNSSKNSQAPSFIPRRPAIGFVLRLDAERRRDLVERLKEELAVDKNQVIALWGAGGVGKTTLAAEIAREMEEYFAGSIVWANAEGLRDFTFATLLNEIATQLGQPEMRTLAPGKRAKVVSALASAEPTLVVLDNFETIKPDEQAQCIAWLTQETTCPTLITTRSKIDEVRNIQIAMMSPEEAQEFLRLLIEEAQDKNVFTKAVRKQIIEAGEANPYVMQWLFAQINLTDDPKNVFADLAHGVGDAATRVFDRSFYLMQLGDDGRTALLALALFVPDASYDALAQVAGFGNDINRVREATQRLSALHLISIIEGEHGRRLAVTGLTRTFAKTRLEKDDHAADFRQRFVAHFLKYAEAHRQATQEDIDALDAERSNVLNALDIAYRMEDWLSVVIIHNALSTFLYLRGYWDDAIRCGEQALRAARNAQTNPGVASFTHNLAMIYQSQGDLAKARQLYNESLEINKKLSDQSGIASMLHNLAAIAQNQGELEEARRLYNESLEINKKLSDQSGIAITLHALANLLNSRGELEEARRLYGESLEIKEKLGNQSGIASTLHELGRIAQEQGELEEARRLYSESLEIKEKLGNQSGIAITLHALANLLNSRGELEEARQLYEESLSITKKLGDKNNLALIYYNLGLLTEQEGNNTEAMRLWRESLSMFEELRSPNTEMVRRELARMEGEDS